MNPISQSQARRYLEKCPPATSGQGGHNQTFKVACALVHGFALEREEALELLRGYNHRCQPPWSEKELAHKIDDAMKVESTHPSGYLLRNTQSITCNRTIKIQPYRYPASTKLKEIRTQRTNIPNSLEKSDQIQVG
ncbi:MAG: hypothetical protein Q7Q73_17260 [Verrucomicrobiota bacterium JB024]|nr:hypothetical protein [Verrucomicrobiota bacterium JB024]